MSTPSLLSSSTPTSTSCRPPGEKATAIRGTLLVVEDDPAMTRILERILRKAGYRVESTLDAALGLARFRQGGIDVVVSDLRLPGSSGLDLLRGIRESDLDVPVIITTGCPDVQSAAEAVEYGAFRYVIKPVDMGQLLSLVARALRLHQMARVRREILEQEGGAISKYSGDKAETAVRFDRALAGLWMAYQPIVSWSGRTNFAHEALVRTEEPTLRNPMDLFDAAERLGRLHDLGQAIRRHVAGTVAQLQPTESVFVNIHPCDLSDPSLFSSEAPLSAFAARVVLEITERAALDKIRDLIPRIARLRAMGYRIALDDLGAGYAGLASFAQLEPEVAKVDMAIIRGIDASVTKQKLLGSIISLCRDLEIQLVAEGIETEAERDTVVRLGGDLCQGYLFARPGRPFPVGNFGGPIGDQPKR
jgi:EAL domain-containing protein (putative c-di-GMP-specific phosphodiesterase class I)